MNYDSRFTFDVSRFVNYLLPLLAGTAVLFIPLVRDFHIESAMIAATVGAFWAGIAATKGDAAGRSDTTRATGILGVLYLAALPLLAYTLITGCYTVHGLGFWLLYPVPAVFFGYAIGRLARSFSIPYPAFVTTAVLLLVAAGIPAYEFFTLPQLNFFNHVWGGWPGPIYDEAVRLTWPVLGFRFLTLCWILILWFMPELRRDAVYRWIVGLSAAALVISYTQLEQMGIISPSESIRQRLGGALETTHARLYFDRGSYSDREIELLADEVEFYIHQAKVALDIDKPDSTHKIEAYLYAHPWQKKGLVGAKYTSYVTVWQNPPQIHIAKGQIEGSIEHEVVHAVTALMDEPGLLPNIGLTEGIAVALDPDRSPRSTIDQLVASQKPYPTEEEMASALSYWGFYTGRSAVSYTTAGSFVRYLIEDYPPEYFVKAYETGSLSGAYPVPFGELVEGWHRKLDTVSVDSSDRRRAGELFGRLSILEQHCPHKVSHSAELFDRFRFFEAVNDTSRALARLNELKRIEPEEPYPKLLWLSWSLQAGNVESVIRQADPADTLIDAHLFYADAFRLDGRAGNAGEHLNRAIELVAQKEDTTYGDILANRLDSLQWSYDLAVRYDHKALDPADFRNAYYLIKIRSLRNALKENYTGLIEEYSRLLHGLPVGIKYFETYLSMIHRLAHAGSHDPAADWLGKLSQADLNLRYRERLQQEREWLAWIARKDMHYD